MVGQFNKLNNLKVIARAHQLVMEGYKPMFKVSMKRAKSFLITFCLFSSKETLVTVWSAPNYCYRCGNVAAIMEVDDKLQKTFKIFEAAPQDVRGAPTKRAPPSYFL